MKRFLALLFCCVVLSASHPWTGITTTQLAKRMSGPPRTIQTAGAGGGDAGPAQ